MSPADAVCALDRGRGGCGCCGGRGRFDEGVSLSHDGLAGRPGHVVDADVAEDDGDEREDEADGDEEEDVALVDGVARPGVEGAPQEVCLREV